MKPGIVVIKAVLAVVFVGISVQSAAATVMHGDFSSTSVDFLQVDETTPSPGDPPTLWESPTVNIGNVLDFSPSGFISTATGGSSDITSSFLETTIMATGGAALLELTMQIAGSTVLTSFPPFGTPVTNSSVSLDGFLTIIEDLSGPIAPVVVPFVAIFTSSDTFALPGDFGESAWTGSFSVDIAAVVPDASKLLFQADTSLVSNAGDGESSAIMQLTGGSIDVRTTVVPLPAAAWLFGSALLGLGAIKRRKS